jgi:hypothetical protein
MEGICLGVFQAVVQEIHPPTNIRHTKQQQITNKDKEQQNTITSNM